MCTSSKVYPVSHLTLTQTVQPSRSQTVAPARALVFLHYRGGSSRTWRDVIDRLGGKPRAIALDQRGWGGSVASVAQNDFGQDAPAIRAGIIASPLFVPSRPDGRTVADLPPLVKRQVSAVSLRWRGSLANDAVCQRHSIHL